MAELTFPTGLAPKQLPAGYGNAGADEVALLNQYGRGIRGDPGIMLPQIMAARRRQQAADDYMAQQTQQTNQQGERMYGDYINRADNLAQGKQAIDLLNARKDAPITGLAATRRMMLPGTEGAFQAVDEQNFARGGAEVDKLDSEALQARANAANTAEQGGYGIDARLLRLGNFTKGLSRQERVENIKGNFDLQKEKLSGDNQNKSRINTKLNPGTGAHETTVTSGSVAEHDRMMKEIGGSNTPISSRPGAPPQQAVTRATKILKDGMAKSGIKEVTPLRVMPNGNIQVRMLMPNGKTEDVEYKVGPDGIPDLIPRKPKG